MLVKGKFVKKSRSLYWKSECLSLLALLIPGLVVQNSIAEPYAGIALTYSNAEYQPNNSVLFREGSPIAASVQAGYFFSDYLALEARYSTSLERDSGINLDHLSSVVGKINLPVAPQVALYALAGYSAFTLDKQGSASIDDSGFSFGTGVHYALNSRDAISLDFISHGNGNIARLNTVNLSYQLRF
ncbi:porin family protein [Vibrio cholerae]|nr:porin family protein [Vibrio cholerae]EII3727769.1 porin family protein [Vibrio cholerae]EIN5960674.1 porin family protein [Vibrio cholerae]EJL6466798.1 porin family protein [Vibrio cholerae]EKF9298837.1 porin family protein [Vibrio cholerae]